MSDARSASHAGSVSSKPDDIELAVIPTKDQGSVVDPVFGDVSQNGSKYRDVGWTRSSVLMMKFQIGIGAFAVPKALGVIGIIPGCIVVIIVAAISTWAALQIGRFKRKHPKVYGIDDAAGLMFGRAGWMTYFAAFQLYYIFVSGSIFLTIASAFSVESDHGTCDRVFIIVAAIATFILASIPTLSKLGWLAWFGIVSVLASIFSLTIAVGVEGQPLDPVTKSWPGKWQLVGDPTFPDAMAAIADIIFAFSGISAFFPIAAEMRDPAQYSKAVYICQGVVSSVYLIIAVVVVYFCGSDVASPALGSAGPVMKKVCYGIALPGLLATAAIVCHIPAKNLLVRFPRGTRHLTSNTVTHWVTWLSCTLSVVVIGYLIASAVPDFESLVSLIGALLGTFICIQPYGAMWFYDNWSLRKSPDRGRWWIFGACWAAFVIVFGFYFMAAGSYGAVHRIMEDYGKGGAAPWACEGILQD